MSPKLFRSMTAARLSAGSSRGAAPPLWWAALALLCAVLVAPLFVCDVPPLVDYPNHLARMFVLASLPDDTALSQFFAPHWSVIPNLALDLAGPPLMRILPVYVAGRLLIAVAVLLPVLGTVAYSAALGGRWWALGVGLVAYNNCLLQGFLNFSISIGLALLLAAGWLRWREPYPRRAVVIAVAGAPVLFACHLMGLVFFACLIGGAELYRCLGTPGSAGDAAASVASGDPALPGARAGGRSRGAAPGLRGVPGRALVLALVFAVPAILYALSDLQQLGGDAVYLSPGDKLFQFAGTVTNYIAALDFATAAVAIGLPAVCVLRRWGRVPWLAGVPMLLLLVAFLAAPYAWKGTYHVDTRLAVMLGFMLFAGFVPGRLPAGWRAFGIAAPVLLFGARMAVLTVAWAAHQADIDDIRRVLAPVRPGQAVYVAAAGVAEAPAYWAADRGWRRLSDGSRSDIHLGALALIERRAWWPFEFDNVSQQPLVTNQPYRALADAVGDLPDRARAAAAEMCGFDYVLLTEADAVPGLPPERFRLLVRSGFAALYGITDCHPQLSFGNPSCSTQRADPRPPTTSRC